MGIKLIRIEVLDNYDIRMYYEDGIIGTINFDYLKDKAVFKFIGNYENFKKAYIDQESGALAWNENIDICKDSLYLKITGKKIEEYAKN